MSWPTTFCQSKTDFCQDLVRTALETERVAGEALVDGPLQSEVLVEEPWVNEFPEHQSSHL